MKAIPVNIPFSERPLRVIARKSSGLNEDFYSRIGQMGGERLWSTMAQAMENGDRITIRRIAGTYLQYTTHASMKMSRDRIVLSAAAAHADYVDVGYVRDIVPFLEAVKLEIELVRLNDAVFGLRREGSLENPFATAHDRIDKTIEYSKQLIMGNGFVSSYVIQGLSYLGDFPLANAVSYAMNDCDLSREAPAVLSAQYRHLHSRPDLALAHMLRFSDEPFHPWNENSSCGALCDLGEFDAGLVHVCRSLSVLPIGETTKEMKSRLYTSRTIARPLRNLQYGLPLKLANDLIELNRENGMSPNYLLRGHQSVVKAAIILTSLGFPNLAENLIVEIGALSEPWVPSALKAIRRTKVVGEVDDVDGRVRVMQLTP